ncbi:hypothetical protein QLS71_000810 [Mariniflexile litorale]|uniref:EcsC family protein n=1 Tax=Mariniflexile litorale TaxID=3045158 RepID=A0AAU7EG24_9FLAO|nr:hypothetical protein [Mariniflexile sp. KMM 9835]MDQ8211916.1 hypothetical protein [Mariniflexile sp. KMM 9835]
MASYENQNTELDKTIARLELERMIKLEELKNQFALTSESIKPLNIFKNTFQDIKHSPDLKTNIMQTAASITGGYLSKRIVFGKSHSFFKKIIGYALQYGVTKFISNKVNSNS